MRRSRKARLEELIEAMDISAEPDEESLPLPETLTPAVVFEALAEAIESVSLTYYERRRLVVRFEEELFEKSSVAQGEEALTNLWRKDDDSRKES